jgi:hypothetical protein
MIAFVLAHSSQILSAVGIFFVAAGSALPALGTPNFWRVYGHDLFKMLTLNKTSQH